MRTPIKVCAILLAASLAGIAQESPDHVNVPLTDPSRPAVVHASLMNGGITVTGYNGKDVIVEARPRHEGARESKPDRKAEGMRRIDSQGTGLSVEEQDNEVHIGVRAINRTVDLTIQVPFNTSLKLKCLNDGDIKVERVSGEVDADDLNGGVKLLNISGAVVAKARVKLKSDNGEIYSDFDVHPEANPSSPKVSETHGKDGRYHVQFDKVTYGSINGGGPEMQFTTFNGKIYLRKKK